MTTSSKDLAAEFNNITGTIAEIRDDYRLPCPNGFVCEGVKQASCDEVRKLFNDTERLGLGDIMAGIWCPRENNTLRNCPIGSYCPDSKKVMPCPSGFFCPHKTAIPEISCPHCEEGAIELVENPLGYYIFYVCLALVLFYVLAFSVFRYWTEQLIKLDKINKRTLDTFKKLDIFDQRDKRMKRIRPTLETLARKMEENKIGTRKVKNDILKIPDSDDPQFHSQALRALFNALDDDDSGTLSYNEFNHLLGMNQVQLQQFIGGMNSRAGLDYDTKVLTRAVFVKNFLPVLEECSHFAPNEDDARELFDEMAKYERENKHKAGSHFEQPEGPQNEGDDDDELVEIRFETFREKDFFHFLSQQQTNDLMKRFRWLRTQQNKNMQNRQQSNSGGGRARRNTLLGGGFTKEHSVRDGLTIGRDEFVKNYPKLLKEVVTTNAARRDSKSGESSGAFDEECETIDITFEDLSLSVEIANTKVYIVDHVTGRLRAKTMTALMGGSGAGKTSLLNALCGRAFYGAVEGKIWINGNIASIEEHKDAVGFVPQDDTVYAELTVKENLIYSGKFRSERGTDILDIEDRADSTLAKLGLARVANTIVGDVTRRGVSGGEKKRVNIGVELMGLPSIIFLDEPTSGLDASSALLVMSSLKKLVDQSGVTVCAVIHQPRKVIFDLFDSLILLSVGGKMCFHGPTDKAKDYFQSRGYHLPVGESVADWLIDISSGQLAPDEDGLLDNQATTRQRKSTMGLMGDGSGKEDLAAAAATGGGGATNLDEEESDVQALRREQLSKGWIEYFDKKNKNITKKSRLMYYSRPEPTDLPSHIIKPTFLDQLGVQLLRAVLVGRRNIFYKFVDTCIIVFVGIFLSLMQGTTVLSEDADPQGIRLKYLVTEDPALVLSNENDKFFEQLFAYSMRANEDFRQYGLKAGVILAVIIGLTATKPMTEKRVEFFRESGSGYDVNAYFLAMNIVTTVEHSAQLVIVGSAAYWLRDSIVGRGSYYASFLMLAWLTVSWALLLSVVVPPKNIFNIVGFFMAFSGLLFSGASPPILYAELYSNPVYGLICGFFSPTRFFTEGLAVSEHRCLPAQSGFTQEPYAVNFPPDKTAFAILGLAENDSTVTTRTCNGWFWYILPCIMVGVTIRIAAGGLIHVVGRSQQAKRSFSAEIKAEIKSNGPKTTTFTFVLYMIVLLASITISTWLLLRQAA
ncbi:Putative white-brown complex homolog protein 30 [Seminavis robusta]|uniref:White-brown complex homolog protein 30 n=1 Tax=Seminavis robusta TaxID=568900 RepID=A0A9N8DJE8_9STRA|nr:Putative white-brown complex homolog protein 30 [Seminavis robusta]|eukprot:Sro185_g080400.1 Putative white-brown complex homolog protein 30 (1198) ;mRNA; f:64723-68779